MSDQALLTVSFGTSYDDARRQAIDATEAALSAAFPGLPAYRAFTSGMVRRALRGRGIDIPGMSESLARMQIDGVKDVICQPTHLIYGEEYDKLCAALEGVEPHFRRVAVGRPLLADYDDIARVLRAVSGTVCREPDEALVLMGHGTKHFCNTVYAAMDYFARRNGFRDVCIGTVEAWPDLVTAIDSVRERGFARAVLTPLMLVAGDHARNDMNGPGPESWLSRFRAAGIQTRAVVRGLGEYPEIRRIYCDHAREASEHVL